MATQEVVQGRYVPGAGCLGTRQMQRIAAGIPHSAAPSHRRTSVYLLGSVRFQPRIPAPAQCNAGANAARSCSTISGSKVAQHVHLFVRHTDDVDDIRTDEIKDEVRTFGKAVVAVGYVRTMFAGSRLLSQPVKSIIQRTHVFLALRITPLLASESRDVSEVVVGSCRNPKRRLH